MTTAYSSRSSAIRAAKAECKRIYGPAYEAAEGPDYIILPQPTVLTEAGVRTPCAFQLRCACEAA